MFWSILACNFGMEQEAHRNIVLVVVDTLRADHLGIYGGKNPNSLNLDQFAQDGVYFSRAYAHSGWTLPSFASMWTGLYPHEHLVGRSPDSLEEFGALPEKRTTLAELMKTKGYRTAAIVNNTFLAPDFGLSQGFDTYLYQGADNTEFRSARETTDLALDWWRKTDGSKFLVVHYMEPHMDLNPPKISRGRFLKKPSIPIPYTGKEAFQLTKLSEEERSTKSKEIQEVLDLYDEEIQAIDLELTRLYSDMHSETTVFVFTTDHGEEFWDHGGFEHGHHLKGELTRVPLIFWGEGIPKTGRVDSVVSHSDLFASILDISAIEAPSESHGTSVFSDNFPQQQMILSENTLYGEPMLSVVNHEYRLEINQKNKMAALWKLNSEGMEEAVVEENLERLSQPFFQAISAMRGGVEPVQQVAGPSVPNQQAFQQLKLLGYIEDKNNVE